MDWLMSLRLDSPKVVITAWAIALLCAAPLFIKPVREKSRRRKARLILLACMFGGALITFVVSSILVDHLHIFGEAPVPTAVRVNAAAALALIVTAIAMVLLPRKWGKGVWRRCLAGLVILLSPIAAIAGANAEWGYVRTLASLAPIPTVDTSDPSSIFPRQPAKTDMPTPASAWQPPADMAKQGTVIRTNIPGTISNFTARPAAIYFPPAASTPNPPILPVAVMLSGQPGDPTDILIAGQMQIELDQYAKDHAGLAPIVVSVDQLGSREANPMCIDSSAGASRTYIEQDVTAWISQNLNVATNRLAWSFGGFSQGGTCAHQIGLDHPETYGTVVTVSAELSPSATGDVSATINKFFNGDKQAYDKITPIGVMKARGYYQDTMLIQGVGERDAVFTKFADELSQQAKQVGITVERFVSPGTTHDFNTVSYTMRKAIPILMQRSGVVH